MIRVELALDTAADAADIVDALLAAADRSERRDPEKAARLREVADGIGDGLDRLARPKQPAPRWMTAEDLLEACGFNLPDTQAA
jgi:hypothetical protein